MSRENARKPVSLETLHKGTPSEISQDEIKKTSQWGLIYLIALLSKRAAESGRWKSSHSSVHSFFVACPTMRLSIAAGKSREGYYSIPLFVEAFSSKTKQLYWSLGLERHSKKARVFSFLGKDEKGNLTQGISTIPHQTKQLRVHIWFQIGKNQLNLIANVNRKTMDLEVEEYAIVPSKNTRLPPESRFRKISGPVEIGGRSYKISRTVRGGQLLASLLSPKEDPETNLFFLGIIRQQAKET